MIQEAILKDLAECGFQIQNRDSLNNKFVDCVADRKKPEVTVYDGTKSTQIGFATTQAWKTGNIVKIQYD